jgi:hypothetical protein
LNGLLKESKQRAIDLKDAFTAIKEEAIEINNMPINFLGTTTIKSPSFKQSDNILAPGPKLDTITKGLTEQQEELLELSDTFAGFFSDVNLGFQGMIDGVITGIKRLVMELVAKAVFLTILTVITGGTINPAMFKMLLPSFLQQGSGGGGGGGGVSASAMNNVTGERLIASVNGKDLRIVMSRG